MILRGERNAPELPIPYSKITEFANNRDLSGAFAGLVWAYENEVMNGVYDKIKKNHVKNTKEMNSVQHNRHKPTRPSPSAG